MHAGSNSHSLILIQHMPQQFIVLRDISTSKSDMTVHQTLWNI